MLGHPALGAIKKLLQFFLRCKPLFLRAVLAQAVQSIIGATFQAAVHGVGYAIPNLAKQVEISQVRVETFSDEDGAREGVRLIRVTKG
jgi:hypothetical protein